jgi:hypothetical protein
VAEVADLHGAATGGWADQPPSPLSTGGPRLAQVATDLPEVRQLVADGWQLAPDAPLWAFLPAVWPREHRTWVADRSTYYVTETCETAAARSTRALPLSEDEQTDLDGDRSSLCAEAGVAGWRPGRLWLLRGPEAVSVEDICARVVRAAEEKGVAVICSADFVAMTTSTVHAVFNDEAEGRTGP